MRKTRKKLKKCAGMSLAETLMAMLILLLVSSVIAAGIPAAANAYRKAVDAANAYALLSETVNALRSEFSTAWGVQKINDTDVVYYSSKTGAKTKLSLNGIPKVYEYVDYDSTDYTSTMDSDGHDLVSSGNLSISFNIETSQSDDKPLEMIQFKDFVVKNKSETTIAELKDPDGNNLTITIRLLRPEFRVPELPKTGG